MALKYVFSHLKTLMLLSHVEVVTVQVRDQEVVPFVQYLRPKIGPANYWSLTLQVVVFIAHLHIHSVHIKSEHLLEPYAHDGYTNIW